MLFGSSLRAVLSYSEILQRLNETGDACYEEEIGLKPGPTPGGLPDASSRCVRESSVRGPGRIGVQRCPQRTLSSPFLGR